MSGALSVGERIVVHLANFSKYQDSYDVPIDISQDGIAVALRISRAHAALELKKLKESHHVTERLRHIKFGKTRRKVYFLTAHGEEKARLVTKYAENNNIDLQQFLDIRKCKGPELWESLDERFRPILAMACVFRRPFRRRVLPELAATLLPADTSGMVDLPKELKDYIVSQVDKEKLRDYHSFAADYWMHWGETRERLHHLVAAKRFKEAEALFEYEGKNLLLMADNDLLEIITNIDSISEERLGIVHYMQAEISRRVGRFDYCLKVSKRMQASRSPTEKFDGLIIEGLLHMDRNDYQRAHDTFAKARLYFGAPINVKLECYLAESLMKLARYDEARQILEGTMPNEIRDLDDQEKVYFLLGMIALRTSKPGEAISMFCKSRASTVIKRNELYTSLSEAYALMGRDERSLRYALKAKNIRESGSA